MDRFAECLEAYDHAMARSREMIKLFDALTILGARSTNDDALRAAYIQSVSSFDYFVHELFAVEAIYRLKNSIHLKGIQVPHHITLLEKLDERVAAVSGEVRKMNSFRAFVAPGKLSEALGCFCKDPWNIILSKYNQKYERQEKVENLKKELELIWKRRNKIAHEADIDPTLAGISLWPIYKNDAVGAIDFLYDLGLCLPEVIATEHPREKLDSED